MKLKWKVSITGFSSAMFFVFALTVSAVTTTITVPIKNKNTERELAMSKTLTVGIQGKASSTIKDMEIISTLLKGQTGIDLKAIPEDNILLRLEWLKNGKIDLFYEGSNATVFH